MTTKSSKDTTIVQAAKPSLEPPEAQVQVPAAVRQHHPLAQLVDTK